MLGLQSLRNPQIIQIPTLSPNSCRRNTTSFPSSLIGAPNISRSLRLRANNDEKESRRDSDGENQRSKRNEWTNGNDGNGETSPKSDGLPAFNFRFGDLLNPDPDNLVAVGLTGLLTWASVQVLWQLLFISVAIVVAALKYSFIAALLIFILITLL